MNFFENKFVKYVTCNSKRESLQLFHFHFIAWYARKEKLAGRIILNSLENF